MEITASYSELNTYRQCPLKHELAYKERWVGEIQSPALVRGTRWHAVLEQHYLALAEGDDPQDRVARRGLLDGDDEEDSLLRWMYDGYVQHYGSDSQWKVQDVELKAEVPLPVIDPNVTITLKARVDLIVEDQRLGGLWVVDHKSGKNLPKTREVDLDDQFGLYQWCLSQLGRDVIGSIHSAARTHRNKNPERYPQPLEERHTRIRMNRTPVELDQLALEAATTLTEAYLRQGPAPRYPNPDRCRWGCDYTEACLMMRKGAPREETMDGFGFRQDFTRH